MVPFIHRHAGAFLAAICVLGLATVGGVHPGDPPEPDRPLNEASFAERTAIRELLGHLSWPHRVIGVLRLQRFDCPQSATMLETSLDDPSANVRSFALLVLAHRGVEQAPTWLSAEGEPKVIRTALRCGYTVDADRLRRGVAALSRSSRLDDKLTAAELGLVSNDPDLKDLAEELLRTIILRMDDAEAGGMSPRLARVTSGPDLRRDFRWRLWYQKHRGNLGLDPAILVNPSVSTPPAIDDAPTPSHPDDFSKIAELPPEAFIDLAGHVTTLALEPLDLAIVMDCTASMSGEIADAQGGIDDLMHFLSDVCKGVRVGVVGYRDRRSKEFEQIGWNFTPSITEARENLWRLSALGGGDRPELVDKGLELAYEKLAWNRTHRGILVLVGDAPPHPGRGAACIDMARKAWARGVTTHVIGCDPRIEDTDPEDGEAGPKKTPPSAEDKGIPGGPRPARAPNRRRPGEPRREIEFFPDIAEAGGGRVVNLARDERLVPEIAGLIVGKAFEEPLVEFFTVYLQICR